MRKVISAMLAVMVSGHAFAGVVVSDSPYEEHAYAVQNKGVSAVQGKQGKGGVLPYVTVGRDRASGKARSESRFVLRKGERIDKALQRWAEQSGYLLIWDMPYAWRVINDYALSDKDVVSAIKKIIKYLRAQGFAVTGNAYANKTIVIRQDSAIPGGGKQ